MSHLDIPTQDIVRKFKNQAALRDFVFRYVICRNEILGNQTAIIQEHLYTLDELFLVLNIDKQHYSKFENIVGLMDVKIEIHQHIYYSLLKLIESNEFIESISPLTNFAFYKS